MGFLIKECIFVNKVFLADCKIIEAEPRKA
jgi:hypothetical protein